MTPEPHEPDCLTVRFYSPEVAALPYTTGADRAIFLDAAILEELPDGALDGVHVHEPYDTWPPRWRRLKTQTEDR